VGLEAHWVQHEVGAFEQVAVVEQLDALNVAVVPPLQQSDFLLLQPMIHPEDEGAQIYHDVHYC
jgi:hypothetical protein